MGCPTALEVLRDVASTATDARQSRPDDARLGCGSCGGHEGRPTPVRQVSPGPRRAPSVTGPAAPTGGRDSTEATTHGATRRGEMHSDEVSHARATRVARPAGWPEVFTTTRSPGTSTRRQIHEVQMSQPGRRPATSSRHSVSAQAAGLRWLTRPAARPEGQSACSPSGIASPITPAHRRAGTARSLARYRPHSPAALRATAETMGRPDSGSGRSEMSSPGKAR